MPILPAPKCASSPDKLSMEAISLAAGGRYHRHSATVPRSVWSKCQISLAAGAVADMNDAIVISIVN